jgi:hypothetical protein
MGGRFLGRPCPWRLIVDQLRALRRNSAVHHLSPSPVLPIRKAIANASTLRLPAAERVPRATRRGSGHLLQPKSLGLRSTSHPVEPQPATVLMLQGSWAVVTPPDPPQPPQRLRDATLSAQPGKERRRGGWGDHSRHRSHLGLGPARRAQLNSIRASGQTRVTRTEIALAPYPALPRPCFRV